MPYGGGGQVFQIDPSYFGLYGAGEALKQTGAVLNQAKDDKLNRLYMRIRTMREAGAGDDAIAAEINRTLDMNITPEMTSEKIKEIEHRRLLTTPEDSLTPDELAGKSQILYGSVAPGAQRAGAEVEVKQGEQQLKLGEQALQAGSLEYTTAIANLSRQFSEEFEPETAKKLTEALGPIGQQFAAANRKVSQKDIDQAFVEYLNNDPKLLADYFNMRASGRVGGFGQVRKEENLALRSGEADIGYKKAQTAAVGVNAEADLTRAKAALAEQLNKRSEEYKETKNLLLQFGANLGVTPDMVDRWINEGAEGVVPLSEVEQEAIDGAVIAYQKTKDPASKSAVSALNALTLAKSRGEPVSAETRAMAKAALQTELTGRRYVAVPVAGKTWYGKTKVGWDVQPVDESVPATPEAVETVDQIKAAASARINSGVKPEALWSIVDQMPEGEAKANYVAALNEVAPRQVETGTEAAPAVPRTRDSVQQEINQLLTAKKELDKNPGTKKPSDIVQDKRRIDERITALRKELQTLPRTNQPLAPVSNK